jgi:hypothetical protein
MGITYDAGALVAAERNDRRMWALHAGLLAEEVIPTVPAPVLAQVWNGGGPRQAGLARLLAMCSTEPLSEEQARRVGALAARARHPDVVDATVVEGAARRCDAVVTSDRGDLERIANAAGVSLLFEDI